MIGRLATILACVLSLAAAFISYELLVTHVTGSSGAAWFDAGCSDSVAEGGANCKAVLASPYSYFPPKMEGEALGRPHLPVAFLGLVYYSALVTWFLGVGRPSYGRRFLHLIPLLWIALGLAGSAYFMNVMFRVLTEWCPWCVATHGLNVLIAMAALCMWPRRSKLEISISASSRSDSSSSAVSASHVTPTPFAIPRPHPTGRVLFLTITMIVVIGYAELNLLGLKTWKSKALAVDTQFSTCVATVKRFQADAEKLFKNWQLATQRDITRGSDDPVRSYAKDDAPTPLDVVVFSDFECPSCGRFAGFFEKSVPPLFDGRVKLSFKNYPIDQKCNTRASQTLHKYACAAAIYADAVRRVGGNDAFWKLHDFLFENQDDLKHGRVTPDRIASAAGLDPSALAEAMQSPETARARIAEDVELAARCEIRATPSVFVEGRFVDGLAVNEIAFWDKLADHYFQRVGVSRPASTKPASP